MIRMFLGIILFSINSFAAQKVVSVESLANDYQKTKKALIQDEVMQRKVMSSLFEINRKMKKIITERSNLVQESMEAESITHDLARKILQLESKLTEQKSMMRTRLTTIYKFGGQGIARLLFSSTSSAQFERNLKVLGIIAKRDLDLIKDYSATMKELESKRSRFSNRLAKLKKLEKKIKEQEIQLTTENQNKTKFLEEIRQTKEFRMNKLSTLRKKTDQLSLNDESGVFDLLFMPSLFEQKGKLSPPVKGVVTRQFGVIRDSESNISWAHKGLFFSTPVGTPVQSVFSGKISFVGEIPGFGRTVIIDHGDHYYTVYSHNKSILVEEGAQVKQNHIIAESGRSYDENESGLYFEIRHFSEPYDPKSWLKGTQL